MIDTRSEPTLSACMVHTTFATAPILNELLTALACRFSSWQHDEGNVADFTLFAESADALEEQLVRVRKGVSEWEDLLPDPVSIGDPYTILREDWAESWKRHFQPIEVSDRVLIVPPWITERPDLPAVVEIDPGMSFGTGQHETTRACLGFVDRLCAEKPDARMLDIGCGSGILAITAAKLGLSEIRALDYDVASVSSAVDNAVANKVEDTISFEAADLADGLEGKYDIVVANIFANVLIAFADTVTGAVAEGGSLVLSGILDPQFADVEARYLEAGFHVVDRVMIGQWTSGLLRR
ncbi:MAG: ribosomal protein L11 methyltransferase [Rhodothermales bacterium]|jgi:ribosomal protein L11 methyltransferase